MGRRTLCWAVALAAIMVFPLVANASDGGRSYWKEPRINLDDKASLQRGARLFVNYCMGCHAAKYQRYKRMAQDLDIPEKAVEDNLIWTTRANGKKDKIGAVMADAMTADYAQKAFNTVPPDLSLRARAQGAGWVYNYLRTFYVDDSAKTGVNNAVLEGSSMPHVLWTLQGWQRPKYVEQGDEKVIESFETVKKGSMSSAEFDRAMNDLVNFLVYVSEPNRMHRTQIGVWVLAFLFVFLILAFVLKKEYWKDVDH